MTKKPKTQKICFTARRKPNGRFAPKPKKKK